MTKTRIAFAGAILAATTMLASTAEAGMKVRLGFGFPLGSFTAHGNSGGNPGGYSAHRRKSRPSFVRRKETDKVKVTNRKSSETKAVAKAEPEQKIETVDAESENSSISTAAVTPAKETGSTPEPAVEPKRLECKKFFPSVGMTLTVPCE